ncbi:MAG: zinc ribbon domain-containing protein [Lachnospiraceae bacterium]|nr:zinc ribbon domain-containing protein [Lachnospiraceae bacterium]
MTIEFMFNNIKNIELIYFIEEKYDEFFGDNIQEEKYLGTDYCRSVMDKLQIHFPEIKNCIYQGQTERIAHEEYSIEAVGVTYSVSFTIDTFNDKAQTQLGIHIVSLADSNEYDIFLEKFKVYLKELLLKEWEICTWIIDEQSEWLGMQLYPLIFKAENKMRAFVNKVMTHKFGFKWMELIGLEDIIKGYQRSNVDFKREVPEFNNINNYLICSTAESLAKLILKSKVFEASIDLSDVESVKIHKMLSENRSKAIFDSLLDMRKVKVDIWKDIFQKYFDEKIKKGITDFIKNRNHVAHNKLLTKASYDKMRQNFLEIQTLFDKADDAFVDEEPSDELCETWNIEQEEMRNEKAYIYDRVKNETGIDILFSEQIFSLFEDKIQELYTEIDDMEYFSYAITISSLNTIENELESHVLFSVNSNVDESFSFKVCAFIDITDGMGEDSYLKLWIEKEDGTTLLDAKVLYHNGEAHEEPMERYYIPDSDSSLDNEELNGFIEELKNYIKEDMNSIKTHADMLSFSAIKDGGDLPVADIPCWNCGQDYISVNDDLYPYGKCMNCGEENEISVCERCGNIYPDDEGGKFGGIGLCNYCFEKIEKE